MPSATDWSRSFASLSTPLIADACLRVGIAPRIAPVGIVAVIAGTRVAGPARPARHAGSVDVFLEAIEISSPGDVLVVDNAGRLDEACVGDLIAIEAKTAGLAGMLVWGAHRDTPEITTIGMPVFSYGRVPNGPLRLDPRHPEALASASFGSSTVAPGDLVFADDDGATFVPAARAAEVVEVAAKIAEVERRQAAGVSAGKSLRYQLRFPEYLERRRREPGWSLREHLKSVGGAIEV
jgi:regulator of RNase E activity RraA